MSLLITDPIDFYLDPTTHDLAIVDGDVTWSRGVEGVVQGIRIALAMIKGEWFSDLDEGVPYLERPGVDSTTVLLGRKFNAEKARAQMRPAILSVPGVLAITSLTPTFSAATRVMNVVFVVTTEFGTTVTGALNRTI